MEMEQTLNAMPGRENRFKADVVLELNPDHPVTAKLKEYAVTDKEKLAIMDCLSGRAVPADHRADGAVRRG